jgi:recombination protein RecA
MTDDRLLTIDEIAATINTKMGVGTLIRASEARLEVPRTTTGILAFDLALGGGWPTNQWNEIVGTESDGKTAIAFKTVAANQALDPDWLTLWVASEEFVPSYAKMIGVDMERVWVVESNEMEPVLDLVHKAIKNRAVDCVVIDSIPSLVTEAEVSRNMDEATIGIGAKMLSTFLKKSSLAQRRSLIDYSDDRPITLLATNQWRDRIGVMFGDPRTTPGGKAKNYYFFTRIELRRDEWITTGSKIEDRVGQTIAARVFKNKTYRPHQVAQVDYYFAKAHGFDPGDFDVVKDIVNVCLSLDVFTGRYQFEGQKIAGKKEDLYLAVRADLDLQAKLSIAAHSAVLPQLVPVSAAGSSTQQTEVAVGDNET